MLGGLVSSLFSSRLGSRLVWLSLGIPRDRKRKSYISLRISKKTRPRPKRGQRGAHEEVDAPEVVLRSGKGGKRKALLRRGRALAGLCLWGSRKESEKTTEKTKKKVKARKKRYRARSAGLTPFLGVPESRVSRPGRQTVDGFGVKTFKFQKKRSETKKSKKKSFRPKNVGWGTQTGRFGIAKKTSKSKDYTRRRRSRLGVVKGGGEPISSTETSRRG